MSFLDFYKDLLAKPAPDSWFFAGLASSFTDLTTTSGSAETGTESNSCATTGDEAKDLPPCKVFDASPSNLKPIEIVQGEGTTSADLKHQVLVFKYRDKFHAVDHQCPHRSYPLSKGTLYDIEDFGVLLSAGISCPKHGWAFDLFTGESDRGAYRLGVWDVEVRTPQGAGDGKQSSEVVTGEDRREVWVRRRRKREG